MTSAMGVSTIMDTQYIINRHSYSVFSVFVSVISNVNIISKKSLIAPLRLLAGC